MFALLLYLLPYIALFVIALLMPGRRSLVILALLLGLPLGWLTWKGFGEMETAPGGAILGAVIGTAFIVSALGGLISGLITRWILLRFSPAIRSRGRYAGMVLLGGLTIPMILMASTWWSRHEVRIPDEACLNAKHHIRVAGMEMWLPSAPMFTVWLKEKKLFPFSSHQRMRSFCGISRDATQPIKVVNVSIAAKELGFKGHPQRDKFCASSKQEWAKLLCNASPPTAGSSNGFPEQVSIYSAEEYDHKRMLVSQRGAYAEFIKQQQAAIQSGQPLQASQEEDFIRYANGYWIARDGVRRNDAGEPYSLYCYETTPPGMLYCSTTYRLRSGPQVTYHFRAHRDELSSVSKMLDANVHMLINSLKSK